MEGIPPELLSRYFEHLDGFYFFRKDLRRQVIFRRHDLINDAPISRIDLLACRNTLMYLNAETPARVLARLHFALNDGGFLLLGRAETLMAHGQSFAAVDLKRRLSRKSSRFAGSGRPAGKSIGSVVRDQPGEPWRGSSWGAAAPPGGRRGRPALGR